MSHTHIDNDYITETTALMLNTMLEKVSNTCLTKKKVSVATD